MSPKKALVAVACVAAVGTAAFAFDFARDTPCTIDVTTPQSVSAGLAAASKYGCREATLRHRCRNGIAHSVTTLVPSPETLAALRKISEGTQQLSSDLAAIDRTLHKQVELLASDHVD
ncbi:MAG: hypothetical protein AB7L90_22715 [Hyphomicrobiaceae bacterium]